MPIRFRCLAPAGPAALCLAACATAPQAPPSATVAAPAALDQAAGTSAAPAAAQWWRLYQDPALDALVRDALQNNRDLRAAAANLLEARAALRDALGRELPQTAVSAGVGYGSTATDQLQAALDQAPVRTGWRYDLGADVAWEADLFGRLRHAVQAAWADADAAAAAEDAARVEVAAETVHAYVRACGLAAELAAAQRQLDLAEQDLRLQRSLEQAGAANPYESVRSAATLEQTRAALPPLQAGRAAALQQLAVLSGRAPDALAGSAADGCAMVPQLRQPLPLGDGAALLRRRPDVREAERRLAASTARIGVATAALYPTVSFGADIASSAPTPAGLGQRQALVWRVGPLLSWSFPNIVAARAAIAAAEAHEAGDLARFDAVILRALQETDQALARYDAALRRGEDLRATADQSAEALRLRRLQRQAGAATALQELDAARELAAARADLAAAQLGIAESQVLLFKALGGGWEQAPPIGLPAPVRSASSSATEIP